MTKKAEEEQDEEEVVEEKKKEKMMKKKGEKNTKAKSLFYKVSHHICDAARLQVCA
ncbi:unnamed protein product [Hydatigera taeniaeformis]|uniref:Uncharacterized protein n=1 Tax=Hydatigena taeniaeformis TaxID=6205 RepID=A0A0R3WMC6_HYDTA|nr:unnamed protein product [Hydatigera taeniaeformis]